MFKPTPMLKVEVVSLERYRDRLLTYLHEAGVVEIRETNVKDVQRDAPNEFYRKAASYSITISRMVEFLRSHLPQKKGGIKEFIFPSEPKKREYHYRGIEELINDTERFLSEVEPLLKDVEARINSINNEMEKIRADIKTLEALSDVRLDVSYLHHEGLTQVLVGTVEKARFAALKEELEKAVDGRIAISSRERRDSVLLILAFLSKDYDKINPVLAKHSFERLEIPPGQGTPAEMLRDYRAKLGKKEMELEEAERDATRLAERYYDDVLFYLELMENERNKANALGLLARTNMTFGLTGWVPKDNAEKIKEGILRVTEGKAYINFREPLKDELDEMPVKLNNPGWVKPFEMITEMYGVPKHDEIDPTPILAFTYSFFFGFMLTDFLYGLIVGIVAALLVKGHKKFNDGTYKFSYVLLWSAFFTMLMGALFGSYFGDAVDRIMQYVTGNPNAHAWRIVDPLRDPMPVLLAALGIGLAHLFIGYTIGFVVKWKNGDKKSAVFEQLPWMLIIIGVPLLASHSAGLVSTAKVILGIGISLFAVGEVVINGGMAALMIISDFFGFVGNWLSYARLMALALATSGIAMVINVLVQMIWGIKFLYIGPILGVILFFGGQLFSTAINALGAFVHALRLHYVEFFGTFYSGEGKRFEPFKSKREVSKLELEV